MAPLVRSLAEYIVSTCLEKHSVLFSSSSGLLAEPGEPFCDTGAKAWSRAPHSPSWANFEGSCRARTAPLVKGLAEYIVSACVEERSVLL